MSNVVELKRNGLPVLGYRAFHTPDELKRRERALQEGRVAPVIELKDRAKKPTREEDPRQA